MTLRQRAQRFQGGLGPTTRGSLFYFGFLGAMGMFLPFLNVYFRQDLGFSGRQIGVLALIQPFMMMLVAIPVASLADQRRWRIPLLRASIIGLSVMFLLAMFPHAFVFWVIFRAIMALVGSPAMPLADSIIARMSLTHKLNYGSMRLWGSISFAVMASSCGMIWERLGLSLMLPTTGLVFLLVIGTASMLEEGPPRDTEASKVGMWRILRQDMGLAVLALISFLIGAAVYMSIVFDGIYMHHLGGTQGMVGFMFGLTAFSELPTLQYSHTLMRRLGGPRTLLLADGLLIVAFIGYSAAWQPWMLLVTAAIKGLGFGLFWASNVRLISERAPEHLASTVQTIVTTCTFGLAPVTMSVISGEMLDAFGPRSIFIVATCSVVGTAIVLLLALARGIFDVEPSDV
jgi:PPP family 3-phenylpropionic acid transporter